MVIPTPLFDEYRRQCAEEFRQELERAIADGMVAPEEMELLCELAKEVQ